MTAGRQRPKGPNPRSEPGDSRKLALQTTANQACFTIWEGEYAIFRYLSVSLRIRHVETDYKRHSRFLARFTILGTFLELSGVNAGGWRPYFPGAAVVPESQRLTVRR